MEDIKSGKVIYLHGDGDGEIDSVELIVRGQENSGYLGQCYDIIQLLQCTVVIFIDEVLGYNMGQSEQGSPYRVIHVVISNK